MKKPRKSPLLILAACILALFIAFGVWASFFNNSSEEDSAIEAETSQEQNLDEPDDRAQQNAQTEEDKPKSKVTQNEPNDSPASSDVSVDITTAEYDSTYKTVLVKAVVEGISSGTCKATFKKSGQKTVVQAGKVAVVTSYYACKNLDTPASRFPSKGTWSLTVTVTSGDKTGTSSTENINVQ